MYPFFSPPLTLHSFPFSYLLFSRSRSLLICPILFCYLLLTSLLSSLLLFLSSSLFYPTPLPSFFFLSYLSSPSSLISSLSTPLLFFPTGEMHALSPQHPVMLGQCQGLGLSLSSMGISQNPTLGSNLLLAQNASGIRGSISRMNVIAGTGEIILVQIGTWECSSHSLHYWYFSINIL